MASPSWAEGYVTDLNYTASVCQQLSPTYLQFVAALSGMSAPDPEQSFTYCELGCGFGTTLLLLAANYPHGQFIGIDGNVAQIQRARDIAKRAGLGNVMFLDAEFADLADLDFPQFDFVTLHGIWTWVDATARADIVRFLSSRLRVGGAAYVSYNALPGKHQIEPIQRILSGLTPSGVGPEERVQLGKLFLRQFIQQPTVLANATPGLIGFMGTVLNQSNAFAGHEYLSGHWSALYCTDVFDALDVAKLSFVNTTILPLMFDEAVVPPAYNEIYASLGSVRQRQLLRDLIMNTGFRRDLFLKGLMPIIPLDMAALRDQIHISVASFNDGFQSEGEVPAGRIELPPTAARLFAQLYDQPRSLSAVLEGDDTPAETFAALRWLLMSDQALPFRAPEKSAQGAASVARLNRLALDMSVSLGQGAWLAAPATGGGIELSAIDTLLALGMLAAGPEGAATYLADLNKQHNRSLTLSDGSVIGPAEMPGFVAQELTPFIMIKMPELRRLGALFVERP
jgi:SAM-dependent methyltransferase